MSDPFTGGERPSTGRQSEPADATAGQFRPPGFLDELTVKLGHVVGRGIDRTISSRHRFRLRQAGWEHALDADGAGWAEGTWPPRDGNSIEILSGLRPTDLVVVNPGERWGPTIPVEIKEGGGSK